MSAVLKDPPPHPRQDPPRLQAMREEDLDEVIAVEGAIYSHPWSRGNFLDSLRAGYDCRIWRLDGALVGYFILTAAAGEAHLLNLSIAAPFQGSGRGRALLREAAELARRRGAHSLFLEVRPSNIPAQALYTRFGFRPIAVRKGYYPAAHGREDALVFTLDLT